jgi:hypothetical protein
VVTPLNSADPAGVASGRAGHPEWHAVNPRRRGAPAGGHQAVLPVRTLAAVERLARALGRQARADAAPGAPRVGVLGPASPRVTALVGRTLGRGVVAADDPAALAGQVDVLVAVDWLGRQADGGTALEGLTTVGARDLLLAAPHRPVRALTARFRDQDPHGAWTGPSFLRAASRIGGVRATASPLGWLVVWLRRL